MDPVEDEFIMVLRHRLALMYYYIVLTFDIQRPFIFLYTHPPQTAIGVQGGGGGGGGSSPFSQKYYLVGQFLLKSGAISLFRFCFTDILNIFFSFVTCSMHKNLLQNAGYGIKETLFFKIFRRACLRIPLDVLAPLERTMLRKPETRPRPFSLFYTDRVFSQGRI